MTWMNKYQSELEPRDSYWNKLSDDDDHDQDAADQQIEQDMIDELEEDE